MPRSHQEHRFLRVGEFSISCAFLCIRNFSDAPVSPCTHGWALPARPASGLFRCPAIGIISFSSNMMVSALSVFGGGLSDQSASLRSEISKPCPVLLAKPQRFDCRPLPFLILFSNHSSRNCKVYSVVPPCVPPCKICLTNDEKETKKYYILYDNKSVKFPNCCRIQNR